MFQQKLTDIMQDAPPADSLWDGDYKIPWHDPEFSRRMLGEHLSQDHHLASRKQEVIAAQARWITERLLPSAGAKVLDLGCGPGLYAPHILAAGHAYRGIDFGPASIGYAMKNWGQTPGCDFVLADLRAADFGMEHDLAMMLYGELNVFSPSERAQVLAKAHDALRPGGRLVLEAASYQAVAASGQGNSWYKSDGGLFSDGPHLCLTQNHWYQETAVALQVFQVVDLLTGGVQSYRSTTQALHKEQYRELLHKAGFEAVEFHSDWPSGQDALWSLSAQRA